jgi:hypothetical protein
MKTGAWIILAIIGIALLGWFLSWVLLPVQKTSPGNVENQFTTGYTYMNSMKALASTVCNFETLATATVGQDAQNQRLSQLLQYQANYNRIKGDYDAWAANIFLGKEIRPKADLPATAPSLDEMKRQVCGTPTP